MFNKHTNKILLQVSGLMLFLTVLMQTEELLAHDRHQKIFGPANTYLAIMSRILKHILIPFVFPSEHEGIVHGPVPQILGKPPWKNGRSFSFILT